ncbi:MAG: DUF302 domain-containing protein [Clostridiales bacterium]|nr:DUF302 domain-containing protein [Clostridiales bacterium]
MNVVYEKQTGKKLQEAIDSLTEHLKSSGFGVLWQLNFKDKLKEKGLEFKDDFVVLEVCNPRQAKEVLEQNIHIGYVLPCKMVVRNEGDKTYIGMTNPETLIGLYDSPELTQVAKSVADSLKAAIEASL